MLILPCISNKKPSTSAFSKRFRKPSHFSSKRRWCVKVGLFIRPFCFTFASTSRATSGGLISHRRSCSRPNRWTTLSSRSCTSPPLAYRRLFMKQSRISARLGAIAWARCSASFQLLVSLYCTCWQQSSWWLSRCSEPVLPTAQEYSLCSLSSLAVCAERTCLSYGLFRNCGSLQAVYLTLMTFCRRWSLDWRRSSRLDPESLTTISSRRVHLQIHRSGPRLRHMRLLSGSCQAGGLMSAMTLLVASSTARQNHHLPCGVRYQLSKALPQLLLRMFHIP
mmetsp:Transcript_59219/g.98049  ORF Transcript_59219/g.98049 Transcript_59219/m.98049 type:complete len:279 (-) Transcript_59219:276-1112(-)